jgi:predicted transcriptional regulator of viral defense system
MDFERLLELIGDEPVFETGLLLAGKVKPETIRLQLSRWTKKGQVYQLRRGLYTLAPPYQKVKPHPFLIANHLQRGSYVSAQSALSFYGLIPEVIQSTVSVTPGRPERLETPLGLFEFRHIQPTFLRGYHQITLNRAPPIQQAFVASPEKALLDLIYLQPSGEKPEYLHELRLQNLEQLDMQALSNQAETFGTPKLRRAVSEITALIQRENHEYETL